MPCQATRQDFSILLFNVTESPLLSQEWCELVFEGRNKAYGAYVLRKEAGRRYRFVALILGSVFLSLGLVAAVLGFFYLRTMREVAVELEQVVKLKPLPSETGFDIKRISAGRRPVPVETKPGASMQKPELVDRKTIAVPMGIDGPEDSRWVEREQLIDADPHHNADRPDLPVEGVQLTATEVVEVMPMFPGGVQALMRFLDENVYYSGSARKRKIEGYMEVAFIVNTDGTISDIEVLKPLDASLDRAVVNAVRRMPEWKPGLKGGLPTPVKITIPVSFHLQ